MNYLREINAFYDWLETNPLSTSGIALWYALMHINNKAGWAEEFGVAVSVLCVKTGLSSRTIYDARNELKTKGRLEWRSRGGNQSAVYKLHSLSAINADKSADNASYNGADKSADNASLLNKLNKTKLKKLLYMDHVYLTSDEYQKLVEKIGEQKTKELIDRLNSYGHQKKKKFKEYSSHYHTILNWHRRDCEKGGQANAGNAGNSSDTETNWDTYDPEKLYWTDERRPDTPIRGPDIPK